MTIKSSPRIFTIHLRATGSSPARLRADGVRASIVVPRACTVALRLMLIRPGHRAPSVEVLAIRHVKFTRPGSQAVTLLLPPAAQTWLSKGILRVTASATGGGARSRPASVTVYRGH